MSGVSVRTRHTPNDTGELDTIQYHCADANLRLIPAP